MAGENELAKMRFDQILSADLSLYRDIIQWSAVLFSYNLPGVPDSVLIELYYKWLGKLPISKQARAASAFFLGLSRGQQYSLGSFFEEPVFIKKQDERNLELNHNSPFLSESAGLSQQDITEVFDIDVNSFCLVDVVKKWFEEGKTLEQICVLSFLCGESYFKARIKEIQ
ncbi:hypothetical protein J7J18_06525 [bacterium]|nr:hypothetical protein [bacterium]